jgi:hypothetical protein
MFFNAYFHGTNGAQIISFIPIEKYRRNEDTALPSDMDYDSIKALSSEVIQKLSDHRPETAKLLVHRSVQCSFLLHLA